MCIQSCSSRVVFLSFLHVLFEVFFRVLLKVSSIMEILAGSTSVFFDRCKVGLQRHFTWRC